MRFADGAAERGASETAAEVLVSRGGISALFGTYLASRPDLLPAPVRADLARIDARCDPMSWSALRGTLAGATGGDLEDAFMALEVTAVVRGPLTETHRARLRDGSPVLVTLVNVAVADRLAAAVDDVLALRRPLEGFLTAAAFRNAVDDFVRELERQRDLSALADAHRRWAKWPIDGVAVPAVHDRLSSATMLTLESLPVRPSATGDILAGDLASRLCTIWLRSALAGLPFPIELDPVGPGLTGDGRVVLPSTSVAELGRQERTDLWDYLMAVVDGDLETACVKLLAHTEGTGGGDQLRHEFRQIVPFRDGPWGDAKPSIAEHLFMQWERATAAGRFPMAHLASVYRGLHAICTVARHLDSGGDHLGTAIRTTRILKALDDIRSFVTGQNLEDLLDRYTRAAIDVPRKLDVALTLGAGQGTTGAPNTAATDPGGIVRNRVTALVTLMLLFTSLTLMLPRIGVALGRGQQTDRLTMIGYIVAGLLLVLVLGGRPSFRRGGRI